MKKKIILLALFVNMIIIQGCTDLEENVLDESFTGGATKDQIADGTLAPAYAILPGLFQHTTYFALQEISTDEAILPYRGGTDWGDNGIYIDMHKHNYTSSHVRLNDVWKSLTQGISRSVTAINELSRIEGETARVYQAEARGLRAYYSLMTLDLFGLIFVKENPSELSVVLRGNEAVEYIKNELLAIENEVLT
ncbi:MAG TPA: RagB/SusD family nutrient uptake outer membrane protein, partial [Chryseolinea sp.]|nr:RagB/SusD family nutrient uptake outer membrane protein [Chryseolinea sp.]